MLDKVVTKIIATRAVFTKGLKLAGVLMLLSLLGACANTVVVKGYIPEPLVEKLPLTASLNYTETFKAYTYEETEKRRALKSLNFATAQITMFDNIFSQLVNLVDLDVPGKDLVIEPEILDLQYTAPRETKLNLYEVWLKYRLKITGANNEEIADWVVKGYGKTPTGLLTSASAAFNAATNIALRDVGAQLSLGFAKQDSIARLVNTPVNSDAGLEQVQADEVRADESVSVENNQEEQSESE